MTILCIYHEALGQVLEPPFDPYKNNLNFMLAYYVLPYNGLVGYVGINPKLMGMHTKKVMLNIFSFTFFVCLEILYTHIVVVLIFTRKTSCPSNKCFKRDSNYCNARTAHSLRTQIATCATPYDSKLNSSPPILFSFSSRRFAFGLLMMSCIFRYCVCFSFLNETEINYLMCLNLLFVSQISGLSFSFLKHN